MQGCCVSPFNQIYIHKATYINKLPPLQVQGEIGNNITGRTLKMVQNIGINILIPLGVFCFLIFGAALISSAAFRDKAARLSKKS